MKNKFLIEMNDRGYLNQCTDLENLMKFVIRVNFWIYRL